MRVVIVGGGPAGATTAETLVREGAEVVLLERDLSYSKPCGGGIPSTLVEEFSIPEEILECRIREVHFYAPSGRGALIGLPQGYIGTVKREVFDGYLRQRAVAAGAELIEGSFTSLEVGRDGVKVFYRHRGVEAWISADALIGADGAHSRVARLLGLERQRGAMTLQEHLALPEERTTRLRRVDCQFYFATRVSPDFYGWVFPKGDHLVVGTATRSDGKRDLPFLLENLKASAGLNGHRVLRREAYPLPTRPLSTWTHDRVLLVGDAAGLVAPATGEGIYYAMKSGQMAAVTLIEHRRAPSGKNLGEYQKRWQRRFGRTFGLLGRLQETYYGDDKAREAFVELCGQLDIRQIPRVSLDLRRLKGSLGKAIAARILLYLMGHLLVRR